MPDVEIVDRSGRRRRARKGEVLADSERFSMPMQFMDSEARSLADHLGANYGGARIVDGFGVAAGHKPGFLYEGANIQLQDAAAAAYEQRSAYLRNAWRKDDREPSDDAPQRQLTLDELQARAAGAYEDRRIRMANAWRSR
jgi:hypothetical protein